VILYVLGDLTSQVLRTFRPLPHPPLAFVHGGVEHVHDAGHVGPARHDVVQYQRTGAQHRGRNRIHLHRGAVSGTILV